LFVLAHLSDLHATPVRLRSIREVLNKRALGWLSWRLHRRDEHQAAVLDALVDDLARVAPDHVAVTGDLTNLGLASEFEAARQWLARLGGPARVSVVPGNHDVYVASPQSTTWAPWAAYVAGRSYAGRDAPEAGAAVEFPSVRVCGPVALVGLSSARATAPFRATGRVGRRQLERLEGVLRELAGSGLCRVVLIHHPPLVDAVTPRRRLTDASELARVLARAGAELVLHGHMHRGHLASLAGPHGPIPVVGVSSSSALGRERPERRARYHLYRIEREAGATGSRFRVECSVRGFDGDSARFQPEGEIALLETVEARRDPDLPRERESRR
jgi:3',5'-cyclic AMP phosphodiesterase CpdA